MIENCVYCGRPTDTRGMLSHVHFKHRSYVIREFVLNPTIWIHLWLDSGILPPDVSSRALPATVVVSVPLPMLNPIEQARRWV